MTPQLDHRAADAQRLFFVIDILRNTGDEAAAIPLLHRMARLHLDRARDLLEQGDADGWPDLYAGITAAAQAGNKNWAQEMVDYGLRIAGRLQDGKDEVTAELHRLEAWCSTLHVVPSLADLDRPIPPIPAGIAA
jgi:hypothetical protein